VSILQLTQTIHILPSLPVSAGKRVSQPTLPGMEATLQEQPKVTNRQIAEVLSDIADLLESQGGNPYRIQAYRNAARGVLELPEPAADILARGERLPVPGLGERLRARIAELVEHGTITFQDGWYLQSLPGGVRNLMKIEHIGPYTALRLYEELGIDTPEKLWSAARQHRICRLHGFGERSEARLLVAAERLLREPTRPTVHDAA
jgi:DNA polymerase/3'-5' exonuclease PolX